MIIEKSFKGEDNLPRKWIYDTDNNTVYFKGLVKDFRRITVKISYKTAEELIKEVCDEEGLDYN